MLRNADFEDGHYQQDDIPELGVPNWWRLHYLDDVPYPGHAEPPTAGRPECRVWNINEAPAHERPIFWLSGEHCVKIFKAGLPLYFVLEQTVEDLTPGREYCFLVQVYPDLVAGYADGTKVRPDDKWAGEARAGWSLPAAKVKFVAPTAGSVTVWLECKAKWGDNENNWFFDAAQLTPLGATDPLPTPRGHPREQYEKTVLLVHQDVELAWYVAAAEAAYPHRWSVMFSADDPGVGDLEVRRVIVVNEHLWDGLEDFYNTWYPGVRYYRVVAEEPDDLIPMLAGGVAVFEPDDPDPPDPDPPDPWPYTTRGLWGLHLQIIPDDVANPPGGVEQFMAVKPPLVKVFVLEDIIKVMGWSPESMVVARYFIEHQGKYLEAADHRAAMREYIGEFKVSLHAQLDLIRTHFPDRPKPWVVVEGLNEIYDSEVDHVLRGVSADSAFIVEVDAEFGDEVAAGVFTAPVGNPHESQYHLLTALAELAARYGAFFSYHGYWYVDHGLEEAWKWHAGRWTEIDDVLTAAGIYVPWYCGESGAIASCVDGWRSPQVYDGDWARTMNDTFLFEQLAATWNKTHDDRFRGAVYFTTGWPGSEDWKWFQVQEPELIAWKDAILTRYP